MRKNRTMQALCSMVLIISMLAGMLWLPEGQQSKAAESVTEVTFEKYSGWMGDNNGDGSLMFRLATQTSLSTYEGQKMRATVLVDGQEQLVDWIVAQVNDQGTLYTNKGVGNYIASSAKSIIVPAGTSFYLVSDGTEVLTAAADFAITLFSGGYTAWEVGCTNAKFTKRYVGDQSNGDTYVALNVDTSVSNLSETYSSGAKFSSTVLVNGAAQKVTWEYRISGEEQLIASDYNVDSSNYISTDATRIEIPEGTFLVSENATHIPVKVTSEVVLTELSTNNWVEGCNDIELSYRAVYPQAATADLPAYIQVQFNYTGNLSGITDSNVSVYLDTVIDGETKSVRWQIDKTNSRIYTIAYGDNIVPETATSVKICAGTYSTGYTGTSYTTPICITNDIGAVYVAGAWRDASTVRTVGATYSEVTGMSAGTPQIKLTTDSITPDGWKGWFDGTVYADDVVVKARFYFEPNTQTLLIGQSIAETDPSDEVMRALKAYKTIKIKAKTELTTVQSQTGPVVLNLSEDLTLVYSQLDGSWYIKGQEPRDIKTNVSYKNITIPEGKDAYQLNLAVDNYDELVSEYGLWSWFEGTIKVNGEDRTVAFQLGSDLFASIPSTQNANAGLPSDTISFEIPAGTVFTDVDETSTNPLKVSNSLSYVQVDGSWYIKGQEPKKITTNVSYKNITIPDGKEAYQLNLAVDNYDALVSEYGLWSWFEGTIKVNGKDRVVAFQLGSDLFASIPSTQNVNAGLPLDTTVIEIPAGTIFKDVDKTSTNNVVISNRLFYVKVGTTWTTYTKEYQYPNGNVLYYNIDNGSGYMLTSSNGAIEVEELPDLVTGDVISEAGTYNITRVENETLYKEQIVLYKHGDADENNKIDVRDLVAMKQAQTGTSEQSKRMAGTYAADIDRSNDVDDIDLHAMRLALLSDNAATELTVSKGNSVLNGVMPIAGFSTPTDETYITEDMYQLFAAAGINSIAFCGNPYGYSESEDTLAEKHLQLAEQFNLKMYVTDNYLTSMTADDFASRVGLYSMYHSFAGLHIVDEPTSGVYENPHGRPIADYTNVIGLSNKAANVNGYVSLFPYYSDYTSTAGSATEENYKTYMTDTFTNTGAEILSYDHYPIRVGEAGWWESITQGQDNKKVIQAADFYTNLELARKQVEGTGKPFWIFAQAGAVTTISGTLDSSVLPTAAEQYWQINASLAMGAKGIQYWQLFQGTTYAGADNDYRRSSLIGADGNINETFYNAAQKQNAFVAVVDEVLMNATNEGVIVNDSTASGALSSDVKLSSYNEVSSVTGSNAMVGCFDYYGKTALLVVNCDTSNSQDITLNFSESCAAYVTNMSATEVNRTNATTGTSATVTVGAGEAALVIIE